MKKCARPTIVIQIKRAKFNSALFYVYLNFIYLTNFYADFNSNLNLSAIIAINSEFVGFPLAADTV